jgi:AAA ATPase domain
MAETALRGVHVDREEELARFKDMITGRGTRHILLIQAERGMGKSSLLREFWEQSAGLSRILVDLKPRTHSVEGVLGELGSQNRSAFKGFFERVEQLSSSGGVYINRSEISKSQFDIQLQLGSDTPESREIRRLALTQAFFSDLAASNPRGETTVVIFDTYEAASDDVKDWLSRLFLTRARGHRWLLVVVAGRSIPQLGIGWDDLCLKQTLRPLGREHVGEYLRHAELQLSDDAIAVIYEGTQGIPLDMSTFVGNLLRRREGIGG